MASRDLTERVRDNYHTVLLARNKQGLIELNRLIALSSQEDHFYYNNRLSFEEFLGISDNIVKTSACLASPLRYLPEDDPWFEKLLNHYDYLEVQPHYDENQMKFNERLLRFSQLVGKPIVAGTDTHCLNQYDAECRSILMLGKGMSYGDEDRFDLTYHTVDGVAEMFRKQGVLSEDQIELAIANTNRIDESCESFDLDLSIKYPILYGSPEEDAQIYRQRCWSGLDQKVKDGVIPESQRPAFEAAIEEENRVFDKLGMGGFMLSMSDLVSWCKSQGYAIGTARGSVGGSRTAYLTDIIDLNPETWNTIFSRFCNEDRVEVGDSMLSLPRTVMAGSTSW